MLIATRGVAAVRMRRACDALGIESIAVYDDLDFHARHAVLASEAYAVRSDDGDAYSDVDALLRIARIAGCDGFHPGDGPLASHADAAARVEADGLVWVGSPAASLSALPRIVPVADALSTVRVDLAVDDRGATVLGRRAVLARLRGTALRCESLPDGDTRFDAAAVAAAAGSRGLVTVELDRTDGRPVEVLPHWLPDTAVSEEASRADLAVLQLRLACGETVDAAPLAAGRAARGFAVTAADPRRGALRSSGIVTGFSEPEGPGVRVDSALIEGATIDNAREQLLGWVTVTARDGDQVRARARRAAREVRVTGVFATAWEECAVTAAADSFDDRAVDPGIERLATAAGLEIRVSSHDS